MEKNVCCVSIKHNMIDDNPSSKLQVLLTACIKPVTQTIAHWETVRVFTFFSARRNRKKEKKKPLKHRQPSPAPVCYASL